MTTLSCQSIDAVHSNLCGVRVRSIKPERFFGMCLNSQYCWCCWTDVFLIVPQRNAPSERVVAAVTSSRSGSVPSFADGRQTADEDADISLPATAAAWERAAVALMRTHANCPDWALEWIVYIRPWRLAVAVGYLALWIVLAKLSLGPVFTLLTIVVVIFCNLGTRQPGEASAYSIFNDGVRLPGQLDANEIDRQVREGQGLVR